MSSQFKFSWSQFKFLNLIFNCIEKKNRGTSSIQFNFLIHQLTVQWYTNSQMVRVTTVPMLTFEHSWIQIQHPPQINQHYLHIVQKTLTESAVTKVKYGYITEHKGHIQNLLLTFSEDGKSLFSVECILVVYPQFRLYACKL